MCVPIFAPLIPTAASTQLRSWPDLAIRLNKLIGGNFFNWGVQKHLK